MGNGKLRELNEALVPSGTHLPLPAEASLPISAAASIPTDTPADAATSVPTTDTPANAAFSVPTDIPTNAAISVQTHTPTNAAANVPASAPTDAAASLPLPNNNIPLTPANLQRIIHAPLFRPILAPAPIQQPKPQALHCHPFTTVANTMVGFNPESGMPVKRTRGPDRQQRVRRCGRCKGVPDLATKYPYIDPSKCGGIGGGVGGGKKKCD